MRELKVFCTEKLRNYVGHYAMLFLMTFLIVNLTSCYDDLVEDGGTTTPPPAEIIPAPVYMLLDGKYKFDVALTIHEDSTHTIVTTGGDPWATTGVYKEDVPAECNVLEFEYQTEMGMSNLELFFMDVKTGIDPARSMSAGTVPASKKLGVFQCPSKRLP